MTATEVARDRYQQRRGLVDAAAEVAVQMWRAVDRNDIYSSWLRLLVELLAVITGAQRAAAQGADRYVDEVLAESRITRRLVGDARDDQGQVNVGALAGVASDGRPLESLLESPAVAALMAISAGHTVDQAMATGQATAEMLARTQVADAGREADNIAITMRESVGFVRMLNPPSCSRCVILAGRFYRYNAGFERHPNCDCIHIPADEDTSEDLRTNPKAYFESLSEAQQDRVFTNAGAQAIRDGADMNQVVNARRGAAGLSRPGRLTAEEQRMLRGGRARGRLERVDVFGRQVFITNEGMTTRGLAGRRLADAGARLALQAEEIVTRQSRDGVVQRQVRRRRVQIPRLMPETIYEQAESREDAVRLLKRFGYII